MTFSAATTRVALILLLLLQAVPACGVAAEAADHVHGDEAASVAAVEMCDAPELVATTPRHADQEIARDNLTRGLPAVVHTVSRVLPDAGVSGQFAAERLRTHIILQV